MVLQEKKRVTVRIDSEIVDFTEIVGINLGEVIRGALNVVLSPKRSEDRQQACIEFNILMLKNKKKILQAIKEKKIDRSALNWITTDTTDILCGSYCADLHQSMKNGVCFDENCKHAGTCSILNK